MTLKCPRIWCRQPDFQNLNQQRKMVIFALAVGTIALFTAPVSAQSVFDEVLTQSVDIDPEPPGFSSFDSAYGSKVTLHDNRLIMSGTGSPVFVFQKVEDLWEELQVLHLPIGATLPSATDALALATLQDFLFIGDASASLNNGPPRTGLVYIAEWNGEKYEVRASISPQDNQTATGFGTDLSANSNFLFVGAPGASNAEGRIFVYEIQDDILNLPLQDPIESLPAPSKAAELYGNSLHSSDAWLVAKQRTLSADVVSAVAYPLSPPDFQAPIIIDLDFQSTETQGADIHVRDDVVLLRKKKYFSSFGLISDYLQFRLLSDGVEELTMLSDDDSARGFLPTLAESGDLLHLVSVFDDPAFVQTAPQIFTAIWNGSSWELDPNTAVTPIDLLAFDDLPMISSAAADSSILALGNPGFRPGESAGGGVSILSLDNPAVLEQSLDAGRTGQGRELGRSLARTDSSLIVGAPGWCKVYVLDATSTDFALKQTLSANPPCFFGADVLTDGDTLYVGNPSWDSSGNRGISNQEGQVHVFSLMGESYVEQTPIRVLPHIGLRRLGQRLAMDSERLFIAGSGEVFLFNRSQILNGPDASAEFGTVSGRNGMNLDAGHGRVVVSVSGRLNGLLSIFDANLVLDDTISDSAREFGRALGILSPTRFITTRDESMSIYDSSNGTWSLLNSITPEPSISKFGSSFVKTEKHAWIGSSSGFVTSNLEDGELALDIPVNVLDSDFFAPATDLAAGIGPSGIFAAFPDRNVSQSKKDLLLHVEFEVVIKRDGFE